MEIAKPIATEATAILCMVPVNPPVRWKLILLEMKYDRFNYFSNFSQNIAQNNHEHLQNNNSFAFFTADCFFH